MWSGGWFCSTAVWWSSMLHGRCYINLRLGGVGLASWGAILSLAAGATVSTDKRLASLLWWDERGRIARPRTYSNKIKVEWLRLLWKMTCLLYRKVWNTKLIRSTSPTLTIHDNEIGTYEILHFKPCFVVFMLKSNQLMAYPHTYASHHQKNGVDECSFVAIKRRTQHRPGVTVILIAHAVVLVQNLRELSVVLFQGSCP